MTPSSRPPHPKGRCSSALAGRVGISCTGGQPQGIPCSSLCGRSDGGQLCLCWAGIWGHPCPTPWQESGEGAAASAGAGKTLPAAPHQHLGDHLGLAGEVEVPGLGTVADGLADQADAADEAELQGRILGTEEKEEEALRGWKRHQAGISPPPMRPEPVGNGTGSTEVTQRFCWPFTRAGR